ncbi:MAG: molybdate ABC transporter substrate-binding protein [Candidatus Nanopelagicaceae bacterium]|nr:molybdate ABC transporter substrate-binding protein [Candidatus Nanopelagicaceae bacterium]
MKIRLGILALTVVVLLAGCSSSVTAPVKAKQAKKETLTVFAASSLNGVFTKLGRVFEKTHSGVDVRFSFLSSATLATQIVAGAPADVFASASESDMTVAETQVPRSKIFTSNRIVLATPKSNPFHISAIADLDKPGVKWIQCNPTAPCGVVADSALLSEGFVKSKPVSLEQNVASAVSKLISGEVDAAFIYHTDYLAHVATLKEIAFKDSKAATTLYFVGVVKSSSKKALSSSFVDLLLSAAGRKALAGAGFINVAKNSS